MVFSPFWLLKSSIFIRHNICVVELVLTALDAEVSTNCSVNLTLKKPSRTGSKFVTYDSPNILAQIALVLDRE